MQAPPDERDTIDGTGAAREPRTALGKAGVAAAAIAAILCFSGIFSHSLWTPDEPRVAEIGRTMLEDGDFVVPKLGGEPFIQKPPIYWWTMVAAYRSFGVSDGVARLPSAFFGFLTLLLVYDMARRIAGGGAGLAAVCVCATTVCFHYMVRCTTDPALAFFVALGYWAYQRVAFSPGGDSESRYPSGWWVFLVYVAAGLAFMGKGVVGVGLLLGPILLHVLAGRRWILLRTWAHLPGVVVLLGLCGIWPVLLYQRGGRELLDGFLVDNVLNRFLPGGDGEASGPHKGPIWTYLLSAPPVLLPWLILLPAFVRSAFRDRRDGESLPPGYAFLALVLPIGILLLSIPGTKRSLYLLPLLAPVSVVLGVWLVRLSRTGPRDRLEAITLTLIRALALVLLAVVVLMAVLLLLGLPLGGETVARIRERSSPLFPAAALVLAGLTGAVCLRRWRSGRFAVGTVLAVYCVLWLIVNVAAYRILDTVKSLRPFVQDLAARGALEPGLMGFRLDETTLACVPFYSGYRIGTVKEAEEVREHVRDFPHGKLLTLERQRGLLPEDVDQRLEILGRWVFSRRRVYILCGYDAPP